LLHYRLGECIVDNVPLVAASMGMYSLTQYPTRQFLWEFMAYCAGTGGSILIIGSAAGVAAMGLEKINFICMPNDQRSGFSRLFWWHCDLYYSVSSSSLKVET